VLVVWALCAAAPGKVMADLPSASSPVPAPVVADEGGFDTEIFARFYRMRVGDGDPVYWYSVGRLKTYPDGALVALVEGFDAARLVKDREDPNTVYQLSRKIFVYRHPETNEILREWSGQPVRPIAYPYQYITYRLSGDRLETFVEQGSGERLRRIGPGKDMVVRQFGPVAVYSAPLFLNFETPRGPYQAFENYDFMIQPEDSAVPYQLSWVRYGDLPPFLGPGKAIMHLVAVRLERFEDLPSTIRDYVEEEQPLWMKPPENMAEIRELQKGE
jgi:hypothetical protein